MTYVHAHPFVPGGDARYCGAPEPAVYADRVPACCQPADHPIHAVGNSELQRLAQRLAEVQWRTEGTPAEWAVTEHRRHNRHYDCAICQGDVHRIAAAVLELTRPVPPSGEPSWAVDLPLPTGGPLAGVLRRFRPPTRAAAWADRPDHIHWADPPRGDEPRSGNS